MSSSRQTRHADSEAIGICSRTGRKWRDRFEQEGLAVLQDRSRTGCASRRRQKWSNTSKACVVSACRARTSPTTVGISAAC
jgi:transposase